jgi:hypothetical protein
MEELKRRKAVLNDKVLMVASVMNYQHTLSK